MNAEDLDNLNRRALAVAASDDRHVEATSDCDVAEAELFAAVIEAIKPALPAMSSRIRRSTNLDYDERGLWIAGAKAERGQSGDGCYLLESGELMLVTVHPDGDEWNTDCETITPEDYAAIWDVQAAIGYLDTVLTSQLTGNRDRRTGEAEARARKLRAVVELLTPRK